MTKATETTDTSKSHGGKPEFVSVAEHKSPMMVTQSLKGIQFPATQAELLEQAKKNDAPEGVIANIEKLPEGNYLQMMDVTTNLGNVL